MSRDSELTCASCLDTLRDDTPIQALKCGHVFHKECMTSYLEIVQCTLEQVECPICKVSADAIDMMAMTTNVPLPENNVIDGSGTDDEQEQSDHGTLIMTEIRLQMINFRLSLMTNIRLRMTLVLRGRFHQVERHL